MRAFWLKLKSIRLAVGLISALTVGCVLATLIPQGLETERYFDLYPKLVAILITETGLTRFFSSLLFILPSLVFFINLLACTADRLLRELRKKKGRRHGPDILHVGLLVLVVGSLISFSERKEGSVMLRIGDSVELPGAGTLTLKDFTDERYEDGRPKDWTSTVDVSKDGELIVADRDIRVNTPLKLGGLTIYQASYVNELGVELIGPDGIAHIIAQGETHSAEGASAFFMTVEENKALLRVTGTGSDGVVRVGEEGSAFGPFRATTRQALSAGLQAVVDPGFPSVLAGLILIAAGTALTFAQKLKEAA